MPESAELEPLTPTWSELGAGVAAVVNVALILLVVVQLLRGRLTVPYGILGWVVLLAVPVVGPILVLTWQARVARRLEQSQQSVA
ncbi:hypothetical protein KV102_18240 [Mumia sp. zg.B53]|uniref:hypothetical protein n=1 Tax=unclassified Mumia TaxID=2621872 RepID=UPI001C6ED5E6|nr:MULTISPECIES: hypothetical protein [unclassified Mumia]MBW9206092.1 hypothetical protein [Mumia sp. zg.B17]MBW9216786.1 hypothetical protein [Mumia sp. zg.B53]MDD9349348.1 hypothetical protein [Mumia sp.]